METGGLLLAFGAACCRKSLKRVYFKAHAHTEQCSCGKRSFHPFRAQLVVALLGNKMRGRRRTTLPK